MSDPGLISQTVDYKLAGPYLADKTVCVFDNGLYTSLAQTLAHSFGQVFYHSPWEQGFPRGNSVIIGDGIPGVTRINSIWPHIEEIDLFVFPDIFHGPLQVYLRGIGKRVWGSGLAESLEFMRPEAKRWLRDLGLPVAPYRAITGTYDLRRHLQRHDNQFVKISRTRGDMETFLAKTFPLIEPRLDELEHALGAKKNITEFVVEEPIDAKVEVGYDGFTVDGQYPQQALFGIETKDAGYIGKVSDYAAMPRALGYVNSKLSPLFRDLKYRGFWSSEICIAQDNTPYLIDPCCRMASPPGELYQYLIENLAEILWMGAAGAVIEPKFKHAWGAQLILTSDWANHGWQPIEFPKELEDNVKLHYLTIIGGKQYYVPQSVTFPEIGGIVAGGATKQEAIDAVAIIAEHVTGYDVKYNIHALEEAADGMEQLRAA
jgi:hypothetical protein